MLLRTLGVIVCGREPMREVILVLSRGYKLLKCTSSSEFVNKFPDMIWELLTLEGRRGSNLYYALLVHEYTLSGWDSTEPQ